MKRGNPSYVERPQDFGFSRGRVGVWYSLSEPERQNVTNGERASLRTPFQNVTNV
jgi:hypothetical protein